MATTQHGTVGRGAELHVLAGAVADVAAGGFRAVAVRGDPGIGKTRLLSELISLARARGFAVHHGRATEFERDVPFAVYLGAFEPRPREKDHDVRSAVNALLADATGGHAGLDRYRLFQRIRALLSGPAAIVLDDLHWADESSVELTSYLMHHPPAVPLLLATACRSGQAPGGITRAIAQLGASAVRIGLAPLTESDLGALLPEAPRGRRRQLFRTTRGNPLYLQMLADASTETLAALAESAETVARERVLLEVLSTELTGLPPEARQAASAAAVAGDPISLDLVAAIAELPEHELDKVVDGLLRVGLMVEEEGFLRFRHPLVRAAAYWIAGTAWRTRAHDRAATHLRDNGGPLQLLAHHTGRSARHGDLRAVGTLEEAGTAALHASPATAARMLRTALQLLPDSPGNAERRLRLQWALGRALGVTGDLPASRRILQEVMRAQGPLRMAAVSFSSVVYRLLGDFDEARALLRTELDRPVVHDRSPGLALIGLAAVELMGQDPEPARRAARRAIQALADAGDGAMEAAAHAIHALGSLRGGRVAQAREEIDRASWLMDSVTDAALAPHIELVAPLAWAEIHLQRYADADRHVKRGLDVAYRHGRSHSVPYLLIVVSTLHERQGRLRAAIDTAEEAREASRLIHSAETLAMSGILLLRPTLWWRGPQAALRLADQIAAGARPRSGWWSGLARADLALVYAAAGKTGRCEAELAGDDPPDELIRTHLLALRAGGADRAVDQATALGLRYQLGLAYRVRGRPEDASAAADHFAAAGAPVEEGQARMLAAALYAPLGAIAQAQSEIARAKALFASTGAAWLSAELARTERRLAGMTPRAGQRGALTDREKQIAELVVGGLTNQQVAERLFLSRKTVEAHLSRAFAKLGVQSRVELTRRMAAPDQGWG